MEGGYGPVFFGEQGAGRFFAVNRNFFKEKGLLRDKICLSLEFLQGVCVLF